MLPVAILAGGLATRLHPITEAIPKALVKVRGEPFLAHQLRLLKQNGIGRVVLCVGYRGDQIRAYAGDGGQFGLEVLYSFDGPQLLGTAGALRNTLPILGDAFFVLYGDSYLPCDYKAVADAFEKSGKLGLMSVFRNDGQWDKSNVEFANGQILAYDKAVRTPAMQYIDYGLGVLRAAALDTVPPEQPYDVAEVYRGLLGRGELAACEMAGRFYEVGSFAGIRELEEYLSR
jgi:NDP-sugar pyrophosphorylase family protein